MQIYSNALGELIRVLKTQAEIEQHGPPGLYVEMLELDPETNPLIVNHIDTAWDDTRLSGGVLTYLGVEVPVNPPGQAWIERLREEAAETSVASIPGWATWTEEEALIWFDANVVDFDSARQVLRAIVRLSLALRNKTWPNLEGS